MTGLKYFLGGFLCAVALVYIRDRTSAPPAAPLTQEPASNLLPSPVIAAPEKPLIVFRGVAEVGAVSAEGGSITVGVQEERISYAPDDKTAESLTEEQKIPKFLVQIALAGASPAAIELDCAEIPAILAGINRLPVPFIAHNDRASASFRYNDRLVFASVGAAGKGSKFEVRIDRVALRLDNAIVELFKTQLKSAAENCDTRERWQRENALLKPRPPLKW